jgi:predicted PhzF superfamily epimerase YddE/YHI9
MYPARKTVPLYVVDAFAAQAFEGNPAAVCILDGPCEAVWMQTVAAEMNLSETAFVLREGESWQLRWFTPKIEVDLCGHATLATAHILWETGLIPRQQPVAFETRSGQLTCTQRDRWIEMDFPAEPPVDGGDPGGLIASLNGEGIVVGHKRNRMDYLVELKDEQAVRRLNPDMRLLAGLPVRGVIVTARSEDPGFDFVSRFFAPAAGINEDPVTGSAHCCLAPYWGAKLGKREMLGFQASARGGTVRVVLRGDRVILAGQAVTVLRGELTSS